MSGTNLDKKIPLARIEAWGFRNIIKNMKTQPRWWWRTPLIPALREAEAGGCL